MYTTARHTGLTFVHVQNQEIQTMNTITRTDLVKAVTSAVNAKKQLKEQDAVKQQVFNDYVGYMLSTPDTFNMQDNALCEAFADIDKLPKGDDAQKKYRLSAKSMFASRLRRAAAEHECEQSLKVKAVEGVPVLMYYTINSKTCPMVALLKEFKKNASDATAIETMAKLMTDYRAQWLKEQKQALKKAQEQEYTTAAKLEKLQEKRAIAEAALASV
jgi:hypothetical protein